MTRKRGARYGSEPHCGACRKSIDACDATWAAALAKDANATPTCERIAWKKQDEDFAKAQASIAACDGLVDRVLAALMKVQP
jgi:hypothetical protein